MLAEAKRGIQQKEKMLERLINSQRRDYADSPITQLRRAFL